MALNLDDRLLGEKEQYYASSSEDELDGDNDTTEHSNRRPRLEKTNIALEKPDPEDDNPFSYKRRQKKTHNSTNTGAKGVLQDYKDFNQKEQQAATILNNIDQNTVYSQDTFFEEYRQKRLAEMQRAAGGMSVLSGGGKQRADLARLIGKYDEITVDEYLEITDREEEEGSGEDETRNRISDWDLKYCELLSNSHVLVHLYDEEEFLCDVIDDCLDKLAKRYDSKNPEKILFCKIRARDLGSDSSFVDKAVPTIQCYRIEKRKTCNLGSIVKPEIVESLGDDFTAEDFFRFMRNNFNV